MIKYPCIALWGGVMGSYPYYIREQMHIAELDNAPADAIYKQDSGEWARLSTMANQELRMELTAKLAEMLS